MDDVTQFCVEEAVMDAQEVRDRHARLRENLLGVPVQAAEPPNEHQRLGDEMAALMAKARGEG